MTRKVSAVSPPKNELLSTTGADAVDEAILALVEAMKLKFPDADLGYYLHGSWASNSATPTSDVDILALASIPISDRDRDVARQLASSIADASEVPLDFHVHPVEALITDPYVDLHRTGRLLYGHDYRPHLPEPSLDALARESVLYTCLCITGARGQERSRWPFSHPNTEDEFFGRLPKRNPPRLGKKLNWFASALLAGRYGYAPFSAADALEGLVSREDRWGKWVADAKRICSAQLDDCEPSRRRELQEVCRGALDLENETVEALLEAVRRGDLGEMCGELLEKYIEV